MGRGPRLELFVLEKIEFEKNAYGSRDRAGSEFAHVIPVHVSIRSSTQWEMGNLRDSVYDFQNTGEFRVSTSKAFEITKDASSWNICMTTVSAHSCHGRISVHAERHSLLALPKNPPSPLKNFVENATAITGTNVANPSNIGCLLPNSYIHLVKLRIRSAIVFRYPSRALGLDALYGDSGVPDRCSGEFDRELGRKGELVDTRIEDGPLLWYGEALDRGRGLWEAFDRFGSCEKDGLYCGAGSYAAGLDMYDE
jgi:hypothetical protein